MDDRKHCGAAFSFSHFFFSQITTPTEVETLAITRKNRFKNESNIPLERGDKVVSGQPAIFFLQKYQIVINALYFYPVKVPIIRLKK